MQHQTVQQKINESQERVRQAVQEFQTNGTSLQRKKQLSAAVQAEALLKDALRAQLEHQAAAHQASVSGCVSRAMLCSEVCEPGRKAEVANVTAPGAPEKTGEVVHEVSLTPGLLPSQIEQYFCNESFPARKGRPEPNQNKA